MASKNRGLAADSVTPSQRARIASKGGRAAHAKGVGHEWDSDSAAEAGRKGGRARKKKG